MTANCRTPVRIYQIDFAAWSPPVMVMANNVEDALRHALDHRSGNGGTGTVMGWDATDVWLGSGEAMRVHSLAALNSDLRGVLFYDVDEGWLAKLE